MAERPGGRRIDVTQCGVQRPNRGSCCRLFVGFVVARGGVEPGRFEPGEEAVAHRCARLARLVAGDAPAETAGVEQRWFPQASRYDGFDTGEHQAVIGHVERLEDAAAQPGDGVTYDGQLRVGEDVEELV